MLVLFKIQDGVGGGSPILNRRGSTVDSICCGARMVTVTLHKHLNRIRDLELSLSFQIAESILSNLMDRMPLTIRLSRSAVVIRAHLKFWPRSLSVNSRISAILLAMVSSYESNIPIASTLSCFILARSDSASVLTI